MDEADIPGSFKAFADRAIPILAAGKASVQSLASAYIASYVELSTGTRSALPLLPDLSNRSAAGTLSDAFAPLSSMMLGAIGNGQTPEASLEYGQYLVGRLADSELLGTRDDTVAAHSAAVDTIVGWEGIISANACDECVSTNSGTHDLSEELYRHGNCGCDSRPVIAGE